MLQHVNDDCMYIYNVLMLLGISRWRAKSLKIGFDSESKEKLYNKYVYKSTRISEQLKRQMFEVLTEYSPDPDFRD